MKRQNTSTCTKSESESTKEHLGNLKKPKSETTDISKSVSGTECRNEYNTIYLNYINDASCQSYSSGKNLEQDVYCTHVNESTSYTEQIFVESNCTGNRLTYSFYNVPCEELAQNLLGKILVRSLGNGVILKGRIVETECYLGGDDKASHSYNGKVTPRNKPMYMKPGTTYVYFTYGMYFCFNISSQGDGAAVLVRAVDPLHGQSFMISQRIDKRKNCKKKSKLETTCGNTTVPLIKANELCNGPGKLCISFCIDAKSCNMQDLSCWEGMWIESDNESEKVRHSDVIISTRIGIDSVEPEWALKPLRYYIFGNRSVSRRDRKKEQEILNLIN